MSQIKQRLKSPMHIWSMRQPNFVLITSNNQNVEDIRLPGSRIWKRSFLISNWRRVSSCTIVHIDKLRGSISLSIVSSKYDLFYVYFIKDNSIIFLYLTCILWIFRVFISWLRSQFSSITNAKINYQLDINFSYWFNSYICLLFFTLTIWKIIFVTYFSILFTKANQYHLLGAWLIIWH